MKQHRNISIIVKHNADAETTQKIYFSFNIKYCNVIMSLYPYF